MLISASRRTDIPAFYAEWLVNRLRAGSCAVPNPMNPRQVNRVSLAAEEVDAIIFWTRWPRPLMARLDEVDALAPRYYFQFTIIGNPREIDPRSPPVAAALDAFRELADRLGPERVVWRYDPIVFSDATPPDWHRRNFETLAVSLRSRTRRVVLSLMDRYRKAEPRLAALEGTPAAPRACEMEAVAPLLRDLAAIAAANSLEPVACAEPDDWTAEGLPPGRCVDADLLHRAFGIALPAAKDPYQRPACGCAASRDIGMYDSCLFGCAYCYAVKNFDLARANRETHDPRSPSLLGWHEAPSGDAAVDAASAADTGALPGARVPETPGEARPTAGGGASAQAEPEQSRRRPARLAALAACALVAGGCSFWDFLTGDDVRATSQVLLEDYRLDRARVTSLEGTFTVRYENAAGRGEYQARARMEQPGDLRLEAWKPSGEWLFACRVRQGWLTMVDPGGNERGRVALRPGVPHPIEAGGGLDVEALARLATAAPDAAEHQDIVADDAAGDPVVYNLFEQGLLVGERRLGRAHRDLVEEQYLGGGRAAAQRIRYREFADLGDGPRWPGRALATDPTGASPRAVEIIWRRIRVNGGEPHSFPADDGAAPAPPPAPGANEGAAPGATPAPPAPAGGPVESTRRSPGLIEKKGVRFE